MIKAQEIVGGTPTANQKAELIISYLEGRKRIAKESHDKGDRVEYNKTVIEEIDSCISLIKVNFNF